VLDDDYSSEEEEVKFCKNDYQPSSRPIAKLVGDALVVKNV